MSMKRICGGVLALALLGQSEAWADQPWEGQPLSDAQRQACRILPRALVRAVSPSYRAEAAQRLGSVQTVVLDDAQAALWIGVDAPRDGGLAERLLTDAVDALAYRRAVSIGEHAEHWSPNEQAVWEILLRAKGEPHAGLTPVLVRAVAGVEPAGAFDAADCGGALAIRHISHGVLSPEAAHVPIVVFMDRQPVAVQAWRERAEP